MGLCSRWAYCGGYAHQTNFNGDNMENTDIIMEIDSKIDEFFAELCEEYGIVVNMNDLDWEFIE